MANSYFDLTEEFNAAGAVAALASGQAVVFYRVSMMSKDGDWVLRETPEACRQVLSVLERHGARYRPGAPLDIRWLAGGWSSHFEFFDRDRRRIRCDFLSRPPRVPPQEIEAFFTRPAAPGDPLVVGLEPLIQMKRTQRAKDYPVIGELARLLPPAREIELTTDPDRILELAPLHGAGSSRPSARAARAGAPREQVVAALAAEIDAWQQADAARVARYEDAAQPYLASFRRADIGALPLAAAHHELVALAERLLPTTPPAETSGHADAQ
jgi:hypothetical protein